MIFFTSHTIHVGVKTYERQGSIYLSHFCMFAYTVEQDYVQTTNSITKLLSDDKCISSCAQPVNRWLMKLNIMKVMLSDT